MPKEKEEQEGKRPKNKKFKHSRDKNFTPLTEDQIEKAEKIARGEKVEVGEEDEVDEGGKQEQAGEKYVARPLKQTRTFEMP